MPILFGARRNAPPAPPLTWETAAPDAASAAASAFRRREASLSLSSSAAAAAAALRARPMPPTNVAAVQPKRAHRRSPSVSSLIGRERLPPRDIHRSPSVCSMVERSFRTPSPGGRTPLPVDSDAPPVPKLPKADGASEVKAVVAADSKTTGGAAPLQTQHFRTASQRVKEGRMGSWFGGATTRDTSNARKRSSSVTLSGSGAFDGRNAAPTRAESAVDVGNAKPVRHRSVSAKLESEKAGPAKPVPEVSSRRLLPRRQLLGRSQSVRDSTEKPGRLRQELSRAGSHLSRGTTEKTQAPILRTLRSPPAQQEPATTSTPQPTETVSQEPQELAKKKKKKKKKSATKSRQVSKPRQDEAPAPVAVEDQVAPGDSQASFPEPTPPLSDKPPVLELAFNFSGDEGQQPEVNKADVTTDDGVNGRAKSPPAAKRQGRTRVAREPSESPARSARFAPASNEPLVRHEPPPRSVSPMKSAMKISHLKDGLVAEESDISERDLSPGRHEDTAMVPKKSARVSWDDHTLVYSGPDSLDGKESHASPSDQTKKLCNKEQTSVGEDETMSPRPALPLFGSVRDKKSRDLEERPLVRPAGRTRSQSGSETADLGSTSDADQASGNAANTSKYREPLPAVASLVEGGEKAVPVSDDDLDSDADTEATERGAASLSQLEPLPLFAKDGHSTGPHGHPAVSDDHLLVRTGDVYPEDVELDRESEALATDVDDEDPTMLTTGRSVEPPLGPNSPLMEDIQEEDDETDRCSVYSDACEVLSPIQSVDDGLHSSASAVSQGSRDAGSTAKQSARSPNDWENAKSYWKSLTPDQRRQLEVEALADDTTTESSKRLSMSTSMSTRDTGSERSYQIKPGTRWVEEKPPPVPPKPGMEMQAPAAQSPAPSLVQPKSPIEPAVQVPQPLRIDLPKSAAPPSRSEQPTAGTRTVRIGSFEAVWEPKHVEGGLAGGLAKFLKGGNKASGETTTTTTSSSGTQSATQSTLPASGFATVNVAESRNRSVDGTASQATSDERRGSADSASSFGRSGAASDVNSRGLRPLMREGGENKEKAVSQEEAEGFSRRSSSQPAYGHGGIPLAPTYNHHGPPPAPTYGHFGPPSAPTYGHYGGPPPSAPPPPLPPTTTTTTTAASSPATGEGGYLRQSLRGDAAPAPAPTATALSPSRRRSVIKRTSRANNKDSRFADSSDEDEVGSSHFRSRFEDSSDDSDAESDRRPRPRAKGMARTMRMSPSTTTTTNHGMTTPAAAPVPGSPRTRASSDPGSPVPWNRSGAPRQRQARPSSRRGSFLSIFRRMRDSSRYTNTNTNNHNNHNSSKANPPHPSNRRSGSSSAGGSPRQVLSAAARQVLSSSSSSSERGGGSGPRHSTASAPSRSRQLLVRRRPSHDGGSSEVGAGRTLPRRKFAALRRMLGFDD